MVFIQTPDGRYIAANLFHRYGTYTFFPEIVLLSFTEARIVARSLNLKSSGEWNELSKAGKRPCNIPSNPNVIYKDEWQGMSDFLGTNHRRGDYFWSYPKARKFARSLKLNGEAVWRVYAKSEKRPDRVPFDPHKFYKSRGKWVDWYDFLGKRRKAG